MITLKTIIEHSIPLLNYATRYIVGLNDNLKLQVEDVFNDHIGPQIMTCAVQTKNLNDTVSGVTRTEKSNTATLALIEQKIPASQTLLTLLPGDQLLCPTGH